MANIILSTVVLLLVIGVSVGRSVNLGILAFGAAFIMGAVAGMSIEDVAAGFPVKLFLTLVSLTYLTGFAQHSGALSYVVDRAIRLVRGRAALAPWVFFLLAAVLMSVGVVFAPALVAPAALAFARRHKLDQLMVGVMVLHGTAAGALSPVSIYGVFINDFLVERHLSTNALALMLMAFAVNVVAAAAVYTVLIRRSPADQETTDTSHDVIAPSDADEAAPRGRPTLFQVATLVGILVMAASVIVLRLDAGIVSLAIAGVLALISPRVASRALVTISWPAVLIVTGMVTYIEVWQDLGFSRYVSDHIAAVSITLVVALLLCYFEGMLSAFASSIATLGVTMAIAAPMMMDGQVSPVGMAAALGVCATIVDISPFSAQGALILAGVDDSSRDLIFKRTLRYSVLVLVVAPLFVWSVVIIPLS